MTIEQRIATTALYCLVNNKASNIAEAIEIAKTAHLSSRTPKTTATTIVAKSITILTKTLKGDSVC